MSVMNGPALPDAGALARSKKRNSRKCNRRARRRRAGLSIVQEARLKQKLRSEAPSEPWVEAQIVTFVQPGDQGEPVVCRAHDPHVFPPGGSETAMIRCPLCGVMTPPNTFEHGACLDHANNDAWGASPSALAIAALQYRNLRLTETELPSESIGELRKEIQSFQRKAGRR